MNVCVQRDDDVIIPARYIQYLGIIGGGHAKFADMHGLEACFEQALHRASGKTLIQKQSLHADCSSMMRSSIDAAA